MERLAGWGLYVVALSACGGATSPYVELGQRDKAQGLSLNQQITGSLDCHDGGVVRNDLPLDATAQVEYRVEPPSKCVLVDLVDAEGKVIEKWSDVAWCNGRVRNVKMRGDGGKSYIRATADSCTGVTLTLRLVAMPAE